MRDHVTGAPLRPRSRRAERRRQYSCKAIKLTAEDVAWIKAALLAGRTGRLRVTPGLRQRLAEKFNVTYWCIESIDKKRRWRDVRPKRWDRGT